MAERDRLAPSTVESVAALTDRFRQLHAADTFILPNPWDLGSARYLEWRGFSAVATTSSGFAATLGRQDQEVTRDELLAHVELLATGLGIPVTVDAERCYAEDLAGVAETVRLLASAGAAGCSIEDYNPATGHVDDLAIAVERVAAAAGEAARHGLVVTARTERHLYEKLRGRAALDDTIERLAAFRDVGAEVVYAPGLIELEEIALVVDEVGVPVNVLAMPAAPSVEELASVGVRRVSTGGALTWAAYGGLASAVDELLDGGTSTYTAAALSARCRSQFLGRELTG